MSFILSGGGLDKVLSILSNKVDKITGKGLSTNDYTNTDKGIVDGVTSALSGKIDKITGKGLSTNDYTNTDKNIVDNVTTNLSNKVDKISGKGLSTNDYTNTDKGIVDGVTSALSSKASTTSLGNLSSLTTTDKSSAVSAINEVFRKCSSYGMYSESASDVKEFIRKLITSAASDFANITGFKTYDITANWEGYAFFYGFVVRTDVYRYMFFLSKEHGGLCYNGRCSLDPNNYFFEIFEIRGSNI